MTRVTPLVSNYELLRDHSSDEMWKSADDLGQIQPVIIVGSKRCVALRALPLSGFVASLQAVVTEDMIAFRQNRILLLDLWKAKIE